MTTAAVCFKSGSRLFQERLELSFSFGPPPGWRTTPAMERGGRHRTPMRTFQRNRRSCAYAFPSTSSSTTPLMGSRRKKRRSGD